MAIACPAPARHNGRAAGGGGQSSTHIFNSTPTSCFGTSVQQYLALCPKQHYIIIRTDNASDGPLEVFGPQAGRLRQAQQRREVRKRTCI
ncbi:hypothetical protein E2C01_038438 [Portunus trituberculatus]|uniref:Uncharacterized protein n=1 Tax=Portunus trituberculatus TaxID=210409 RepID=A0A5B7FIJ3_PORTR|nr:hypothetical protein [Portunus trituberculatus]